MLQDTGERADFDRRFERLHELTEHATCRAREAVAHARAVRAAVASSKQQPSDTPIRVLQDALRQAESSLVARDRFLTVVLHELRQPLSTLATACELIVAPEASSETKARAHRVIRTSVVRCTRILDDLLDLSRASLQRLDVTRQHMSLRDLLLELGESMRREMQQKQLQFAITLPPDSMPVDGDPDRLHQVFSNLLQNAMKFTGPGGRVELVAEPGPEQLQIIVRDSGAGIPPDQLSSIFDLFLTHDVPGRGFGVGLAISRSLIQAHQGTIHAESEGPGRGSAFIVRLPRATPKERAATAC